MEVFMDEYASVTIVMKVVWEQIKILTKLLIVIKVAEDKILFGLYNLGRCYLDGIGVEKDENKALGIFKELAKQEYLYAQLQLADVIIMENE